MRVAHAVISSLYEIFMKKITSQITASSFRRRITNDTVIGINREIAGWSLVQKQLFIDSLLFEYDTQKIYLHQENESEDGGYIIDGVQRLCALYEYYNNQFLSAEKDRIVTGVNVSGCTYEQLNEGLRETIDAYEFTVISLSDVSAETIEEIRCRLNAGNIRSATDERVEKFGASGISQVSIGAASLDTGLNIKSDSSHYSYKTSKLNKLYNPKTKHGKIGAWIKKNKNFKARDLVLSGVCDAKNAIEYYEEFIAYRAFFNLVND